MSDFHVIALTECQNELWQTVSYLNSRNARPVTLSETVLVKFIKKFERDFKVALTPRRLRGRPIRKNSADAQVAAKFAPVAWAATRDPLMIKAAAIAALAISYAQQAGSPGAPAGQAGVHDQDGRGAGSGEAL